MSAPLDIDQLQTFVAIADTGSFTKAADRVFKTQSAVSMQMRRLEERIGKPLFMKDGRGNRLTVEGDRLLNFARRMIRLNNEAIASFDDNRLEGTLRIGTPDDYADRYMPEIVMRFAKTHPNVELYIVCEPSVDLAEKMAKGDLDIALVTHNPRARASDVVRTEPLCWVSSINHPLPENAPIPLAVGRRDCLWRQAASPDLHTWVRYLCEFNAQDVTVGLDRLEVRTLLLKPGLEGLPHDPGQNYMENYCSVSWKGVIETHPQIATKTVPNSRVCMWYDQPEKVKEVVAAFLRGR